MADVQMTFTEHLEELRTRLIRALLGFFLCAVLGYIFRNQILDVLVLPLRAFKEQGAPLQAINLLDPFLAPVRLAAYTGLVLSFPFIVYQALMFCLPALLPNERRIILSSLVAGVVLLYTGVIFGGTLIVPMIIRFMAQLSPQTILNFSPNITDYIDKVFQILLAFGAAFQLPLVLFALMRLGIVSPATLAKQRGYIIVGLAALAALLTPPDVLSQLMLAGPLWVLFELSLLLARILPPKTDTAEEEETIGE